MKKNYLKYLALSLAFVLALFAIVYFGELSPGRSASGGEAPRSAGLYVHFLDVGQGDAIYIRTPDEVDVLIDGGPDNSILSELGSVMPFWDKEIDLMILTHPHSDHVAGLVEVLRRYQVDKIIYTGVVHTAPDYLTWLQEIRDQMIPVEIVDKHSELALGSASKLTLLFPFESFYNRRVLNLNNTSIVARLVYGETSFLFTGDIESEVEDDLLRLENAVLDSDVLKVAHHGSESSSSTDFLRVVSPAFSVIQVGLENSFNHPHGETLFHLKRLPSTVYRTDLYGRISFASDGQKIFVEP